MLAAERMTKIVEIVDNKGILSVKELSSLVNSSLMTVRRDLTKLEQQGMIKRTHGGVISMKYDRDMPYVNRSHLGLDEKSEIGKRAVEMVEEGDVIFLGSGTTVAQMAPHLIRKVGLTIVTPSFQIVNELVNEQGITLIFLGGIIKGDIYSTVGQTAEKEINNYHFQKAFLGASGILLEKGIFNSDFLISSLEKLVLEKADRIFILADHSKFEKSALIHISDMNKIAGIITDSKLPDRILNSFKKEEIPLFHT